MTTCPTCGHTGHIVNQCGCDPHNIPTVPIRAGQFIPRWTSTNTELPDVEAGDRVFVIVVEVLPGHKKPSPRIVTLEALEFGWRAIEDTYQGYTPSDGELWISEKCLCGVSEKSHQDAPTS